MIRNKCADQWSDFLKLPFSRLQKSKLEVTSTTIDPATQEMAATTTDTTTK